MPKQSLRKIVQFLNNPEEEGGFWLPNIQRPFVWTKEQICRLFDSILREYPISTLLIWKTKSHVKCRKFIENYKSDIRLSDFFVPESDKKKCLVLDGQQRLQSLFIGLRGSFEKKELYINILSGEVAAPDDVKYKFEFLSLDEAKYPWIKFKDLVFSDLDPVTLAQDVISRSTKTLSSDELKKISKNIGIIFKTFHSDEGISYQELDSTENIALYSEDDVVEIFIRANSGGTKLGKSDLLFSLLATSWDESGEEIEELLTTLNNHGFAFTRDFVLKTCLTLLDQGARYEVGKFRKQGVREKIEERWGDISNAIKDVLDFVQGKTFIRCDKALPSYLSLIPIIYLRFHFEQAWKESKGLDEYLIRSLFSGAFSGTSDQMIDDCITNIRTNKSFLLSEILQVIRMRGRSLEISKERLFEINYSSDTIHLLFNLWYKDFNYTPIYVGNMPQIDHIFPQSVLKKIKDINPITGRRDLLKFRDYERNQIANCMLLSQAENGAAGKADTLPKDWFNGKSRDYLELHLIPKDPVLWEVDNYQDFIKARKVLIQQKFSYLLSKY